MTREIKKGKKEEKEIKEKSGGWGRGERKRKEKRGDNPNLHNRYKKVFPIPDCLK